MKNTITNLEAALSYMTTMAYSFADSIGFDEGTFTAIDILQGNDFHGELYNDDAMFFVVKATVSDKTHFEKILVNMARFAYSLGKKFGFSFEDDINFALKKNNIEVKWR